MSEQQSTENLKLTMAIYIAIAFVDIGLFLALMIQWIPLYLTLFLHCGIAACALWMIKLYPRLGLDLRFPYLFGLFITFLGPLGAGLAVIIVIFYMNYQRYFSGGKDILDDIFPEIKKKKSSELYDRVLYGMEAVEKKELNYSFQEIIVFGSDKQKRLALEKILKYFRPSFIPVLLRALNDSSNSIRVSAATIMAKLDKKFYNQYLSLEMKLKNNPDDPESYLTFAKHCDTYVSSKILDQNKAQEIREKAIHTYLEYLKYKPDDYETIVAISRLYLQDDHPLEARQHLESLMQKNTNYSAEVYKLWIESLYNLQDYTTLRSLQKNPPFPFPQNKEDIHYEELMNAIALWSHGFQKDMAYG